MKKVIVIGAGFSGISAAHKLSRRGYKVQIFEASASLGGRATQLSDTKTGETIDNGQHILIGAYHHLLKMIEPASREEMLCSEKALKIFYYRDGETSVLDTSKFPGKMGFLAGLMQFNLLEWESKWRIISFASLVTLGKVKFAHRTALDILIDHKQTEEAIKIFWQPLITSALNTPMADSSGEVFLNILKSGFFASKQRSNILIPRCEANQLVSPLLNHENIEIKTSSPIKELIIQDGRCRGVKTEYEDFLADYVVSAIPLFSLKKLLPDENLPDLEYSPIVSIYLWFDRDFMDEKFAALTGNMLDWVFNKRKIAPKRQNKEFPGLLSLTISAANDYIAANTQEIVSMALEELHKIVPHARDAKLLYSRVIKEKMATYKCTNDSITRRKNINVSIKNLIISGEWTVTDLPSTLESAVISGNNAANAILKHENE